MEEIGVDKVIGEVVRLESEVVIAEGTGSGRSGIASKGLGEKPKGIILR
jgi:hypothetical protein